MPPKQKRSVKKLANTLKNFHISPFTEENANSDTTISNISNPALCARWPAVKIKVPDIFLHKPANLAKHVKTLLTMGIKFNQPYLSRYYTKITCPTFNDHKALTQYFENKKLPYHTFGHPIKRKMKVVIRGLPKNIDLNQIKSDLKALSIPIVRVHKMKKHDNITDIASLILAVVPYNDEGKKILRVDKILGYKIAMEPLRLKIMQCHRCQMWGHTQRYCHGKIKCVKCAGEHLTKKCERDPNNEPPKCANCGGEHTASYKKCPCCPESLEHKLSQAQKKSRIHVIYRRTDLVTWKNCDTLYKNYVI